MDRLEALGNQLSQITMYDIKSMYNQAKNVVLNVSETEAKVREATNDEPWGASSTLMQEIAQGTFHFQTFNEIMPAIYSRFMEKEASQWRQIYKALQLLEYLIKNGSERVVDDARSHISTIKMLRNFHYIDDKGKDQGINVRNRAKELVELLSDVEKIRTERRKAKANKNKYIGTGNDGMSFSSGGSRYGGFGSDSFGSGGGGSRSSFSSFGGGGGGGSSSDRDFYYGGGGGGSSSSSSGGFRDQSRPGAFEEYNAGDDEDSTPVRRSGSVSQRAGGSSAGVTSSSRRSATAAAASAPAPEPPKAKEPEVDLLGGFDDDAFSAPAPAAGGTEKALPAVSSFGGLDDDDFADFQVAPTSPSAAAPTPAPAAVQTQKPNLFDMLNSTPAAPTNRAGNTSAPPAYTAAAGSSMFGAAPAASGFGGVMSPTSNVSTPSYMSPMSATSTGTTVFNGNPTPQRSNSMAPATSSTAKPAAAKGSVDFGDLWSMSLGSSTSKPAAAAGGAGGRSIQDLQKEKTQAGIWGASQSKPPPGYAGLGSFGAAPSTSTSASGGSGGGDDLLL